MKILPQTTVTIATNEEASLELEDGLSYEAVLLLPRFGSAETLELNDGVLTFPEIEAPNVLTLGWLEHSSSKEASFTATVNVISRHYFTLDQLRNYGDERDDFATLPEDALVVCRQAATDIFEQNANRSFVQRIGQTIDYGAGSYLNLAHGDVYEILTEGYALMSDSQAQRVDPCQWEYPRTVEYLYGKSDVPVAVSEAVLMLAAYMLRPTNRPIGATGESTDAGYLHFTTAGRDGVTAIPEVNAAITQFGRGWNFLW